MSIILEFKERVFLHSHCYIDLQIILNNIYIAYQNLYIELFCLVSLDIVTLILDWASSR